MDPVARPSSPEPFREWSPIAPAAMSCAHPVVSILPQAIYLPQSCQTPQHQQSLQEQSWTLVNQQFLGVSQVEQVQFGQFGAQWQCQDGQLLGAAHQQGNLQWHFANDVRGRKPTRSSSSRNTMPIGVGSSRWLHQDRTRKQDRNAKRLGKRQRACTSAASQDANEAPDSHCDMTTWVSTAVQTDDWTDHVQPNQALQEAKEEEEQRLRWTLEQTQIDRDKALAIHLPGLRALIQEEMQLQRSNEVNRAPDGLPVMQQAVSSFANFCVGLVSCLRRAVLQQRRATPETEIQNTSLLAAIVEKDERQALVLLDRPNFPGLNLQGREASHCMLLHSAIHARMPTVALKLLSREDFRGINGKDDYGITAFHWAAYLGYATVCRAIVARPDFHLHLCVLNYCYLSGFPFGFLGTYSAQCNSLPQGADFDAGPQQLPVEQAIPGIPDLQLRDRAHHGQEYWQTTTRLPGMTPLLWQRPAAQRPALQKMTLHRTLSHLSQFLRRF